MTEERRLFRWEVVPIGGALPFTYPDMGLDGLVAEISLYQAGSEPYHNLLPDILVGSGIASSTGIEVAVPADFSLDPVDDLEWLRW